MSNLKKLSSKWLIESVKKRYSYNFSWLGRPIIQYPQDVIAMQEIIWKVKPDLIIETGIAHGGSLIFYASLLELLGGKGKVIGIDIDIRKHNKLAIKQHPLYKRVIMIEGSSIAKKTVESIYRHSIGKKRVLVALDANHTHEHVLKELELYSPFVTKGSYLVIFDTIVDQMPKNFYPNRPWGKDNNPYKAVKEFLKKNKRFKPDYEIEDKLLITSCPNGFLKCVKN